jgi:diguanylate cyclase (GGDEF)-like protein
MRESALPGVHAESKERQRWGDLLAMAADLAFETDAWGRIVFLMPEEVLGWQARSLLRKPAELLLAAPGSVAGFNPFRASTRVRGRRAWLNRADGTHACLRFTCNPLVDESGLPVGTRGIAMLEADVESRRPWEPDATIDTLTGLPNRRAFLTELARRIERLDRDGEPSTLLCANLDRFRALNARLGPAVGDSVLVAVAALLGSTLRPTDLIGRLGGDGFGMWLSGADHMTAAERAETLSLSVPAAVTTLLGQDDHGIGISIGIAARNLGSFETVEMLVRRADRAMQAVKDGGRGHWRVAHVTEP